MVVMASEAGEDLPRRRPRREDLSSIAPIIRHLGNLGLTVNEARTLVALLQVGPAGVSDVANRSGIHRTNVYPVLEALRAAGLAAPFTEQSTQWACIGMEKILDRLYSDAENRLRRLAAEKKELGSLLADVVRDTSQETLPGVRFVRGPNQTNEVYMGMLQGAQGEVLVFNRAPYGMVEDDPIEAVYGLLERGVSVKALYRPEDLDPVFVRETETYLDAGIEARISDELPTKLVVVDRSAVLVAMMAPDEVEGFPISQHVEHAGFGATWGAVFDWFWSTSRPFAKGALP